MQAETQYARSGDYHIAYQVIGDGPIDLVYVPGFVSNVELCWDEPCHADFLNHLASFSRLIIFDKRGTGLSDRVPNDALPTLEERADDLKAVMDAVNSNKAAIFGYSEGANLSTYFAAANPDRVQALVLFGTFAKRIWSEDYPWAPTPEERAKEIEETERTWGQNISVEHYAPSMTGNAEFAERLATYMRRSASPGAAKTLMKMNSQIDITDILSSIRIPTLIMHRTGDQDANVEEGRWMASQIPDAEFIELEGADHFPWTGDWRKVYENTQGFVTGELPTHPISRILATILFTDIVSSTEKARLMGDADWKALLNQHDRICRDALTMFRGENFKSTGDGILATFDGPGRAISCARHIVKRCADIGLEIRAGLHTGECELRDDEVAGVAVHLGARVSALAKSGEVLVSRTVRDLVAGSDFDFNFHGEHQLKGFDEKWPVYAVD